MSTPHDPGSDENRNAAGAPEPNVTPHDPAVPPPPPTGEYAQYPQSQYPRQGSFGEQGGYGVQQPMPGAPYSPEARPPGRVYSILGFFCAVVAILFCPIFFGPLGIVLGLVGHRRGEPLGRWAAIAAVVGMVIGLLLEFLAFRGGMY